MGQRGAAGSRTHQRRHRPHHHYHNHHYNMHARLCRSHRRMLHGRFMIPLLASRRVNLPDLRSRVQVELATSQPNISVQLGESVVRCNHFERCICARLCFRRADGPHTHPTGDDNPRLRPLPNGLPALLKQRSPSLPPPPPPPPLPPSPSSSHLHRPEEA